MLAVKGFYPTNYEHEIRSENNYINTSIALSNFIVFLGEKCHKSNFLLPLKSCIHFNMDFISKHNGFIAHLDVPKQLLFNKKFNFISLNIILDKKINLKVKFNLFLNKSLNLCLTPFFKIQFFSQPYFQQHYFNKIILHVNP